jgi:hypothetical protein
MRALMRVSGNRRATADDVRQIACLIERAIAEERDACAAIADASGRVGREIAQRIRARCAVGEVGMPAQVGAGRS